MAEVKLHSENSKVEEESSKYEWVVGADGARGVVRKLLGLTFLGETKAEKFIVGDIKLEGLVNRFVLVIINHLLKGIRRWHIWGISCEYLCQRLVIVFAKKRTSIWNTDTSGLFNFIVGDSKLDKLDEITASD